MGRPGRVHRVREMSLRNELAEKSYRAAWIRDLYVLATRPKAAMYWQKSSRVARLGMSATRMSALRSFIASLHGNLDDSSRHGGVVKK
jgi:hypothetical protein